MVERSAAPDIDEDLELLDENTSDVYELITGKTHNTDDDLD